MDRPLTSNIQETLRNIRPPSAPRDADTALAFAQLGELGRLGGRIGRIYRGREVKVPLRKLLFIAAADHGASPGSCLCFSDSAGFSERGAK